MKPNTRAILEECIDNGIASGYDRAHKNTDAPHEVLIFSSISDAIWLEIDEKFTFESSRDLCSEILEGLRELANDRDL
tara:strand:- start:1700 stop:1933 length:234 start_codon:yes stop_codon:yes gene_type:complete